MKRRVLLVVAYDGTRYHGWQIQPNGITVESELNKALSELFNENIRVRGASRTDAGVHALGNLAIFDTDARIPPEKISYALNQRLPDDIRIQKSQEVSADFDFFKKKMKKTYEYRITSAPFPIPTKRLYSYYTYHELDLELMNRGAKYLVGEHDFKSFCSVGNQTETTVRTIYEVIVFKDKNDIVIRVSGNGFLYNMVRIIAGTLMEVGLGRILPEMLEKIILQKDRSEAGPTAPAQGLTLIGYEGNFEKTIDTP